MFMTHVAPSYPRECTSLPISLLALLSDHASALHPEVRGTVCKALIQLRARGLIEDPLPLLKTLFALFRVRDRSMRDDIFSHIVADCRAMAGSGGKNAAATRAVQGFLYSTLADPTPVVARKSLEVLLELYRRQVWTDARSVNVVASALASKSTKVVVLAIKFFLGMTAGGDDGDDLEAVDDIESSDDEGGNRRAAAGAVEAVSKANMQEIEKNLAHVKKTRKRKRAAGKAFADIKRAQRKQARRGDGVVPIFPAIQILHDPQGVAEQLLASVSRGLLSKERFEVRLLALNLVSRVVGQHRLILLPLYSFLQRYLASHQAHVTQVLSHLIQATHDGIPPEELLPVVRAIGKGFVHESARAEVIQVGMNTLREMFTRCPGLLAEGELEPLIGDLCAHKSYKGSKGVAAAARAIINLLRDWYPALLKRSERGKELGLAGPDALLKRPAVFGAQVSSTGVDGEELLAMVLAHKEVRQERDGEHEIKEHSGVRLAKLEDSDEWARVLREKERKKAKGGLVKTSVLKRIGKGGKDVDSHAVMDILLGEEDEGGSGDDEDASGATDDDEPEIDEEEEEGEGEESEDEDIADENSGNTDEEEEEEEEEDEEEEEEDEEEEDEEEEEEDEEEEEEDEEDEVEEEEEGRPPLKVKRGTSLVSSLPDRSTTSSHPSKRAALAKSLSALLKKSSVMPAKESRSSGSTGANLSSIRVLTPKDFARINALKAALAEKGISQPTAADIMALLAGGGSGGSTSVGGSSSWGKSAIDDDADEAWKSYQLKKRKRKSGRGLGIATEEEDGDAAENKGEGEEGEDGKDDEGEPDEGGKHQLFQPGVSYAPPLVSFDPTEIEALETSRMRKQAGALLDIIKVCVFFVLSIKTHPYVPTVS